MEPTNPNETPQLSLRERFFKSWFPPAAVVGGVVTLVAAALRVRPEPGARVQAPAEPAGRPASDGLLHVQPAKPDSAVPVRLERQYVLVGTIGGSALSAFRESLLDVAVDGTDQVVALGDGHVRVFTAGGEPVRQWLAGSGAECLTVGPDGRVYIAGAGRVDVFESGGRRVGGFQFGDPAKPPSVSAIAVHGPDMLVADASARIIRRFDATGRQRNLIGDQGKTKTFMLPNGRLDVNVDAAGVVRATDTGRHQVTSWALDGTPIAKFGKFGMQDPADFVGCCNPINVATTPDGKVVTSEKMVARVKVFEPDGRLLAVIGTEHFDRMCTQIHLAVDSKGRILAADPVRRRIQVFSPAAPGGGREVPS
jgi:sugar lactone lactonase YvrE